MTGDASQVQQLGPRYLTQGITPFDIYNLRLCDLLEGKGGGKGQRFNAKLNNLKKIGEVEGIVQSVLSN